MKYEIDIKYLIANCFDGAANMSDKYEELSTRLKECTIIYVYSLLWPFAESCITKGDERG